jgi:hypothetical protein
MPLGVGGGISDTDTIDKIETVLEGEYTKNPDAKGDEE